VCISEIRLWILCVCVYMRECVCVVRKPGDVTETFLNSSGVTVSQTGRWMGNKREHS
jgi:hypothetical protein